MGSLLTWENLAVVLAVAYLVLAMRENVWCWLAAFASTVIYTVVFWNVSLVMESALNVFYMAMAVYGWWEWTRGGSGDTGVDIHRWQGMTHLKAVASIMLLTAIVGWLLTGTQAARPFVDSFTTVASVITTFMVARKVLENWLYWIVIDAVSIWLYLDRGLKSTAVLFVLYVVLAVVGYFGWRKRCAPTASLGG
ncbi:MAG: nicotinamide mononucleotide transporter [Thalassolituus oleivorans]